MLQKGENRVINEFENGNVYMIESNKAIDFIGEVTILAGMSHTSVTIEAVTDNVVAYISRRDAERWLASDINILNLAARHTAFKLYRSSYNNGAKLFYPPSYLLLDYMVKSTDAKTAWNPPAALGRPEGMGTSRTPVSVTCAAHPADAAGRNRRQRKTLNRTIRQLKEGGILFHMQGKITFTREQYEKAIEWLEAEKDK